MHIGICAIPLNLLIRINFAHNGNYQQNCIRLTGNPSGILREKQLSGCAVGCCPYAAEMLSEDCPISQPCCRELSRCDGSAVGNCPGRATTMSETVHLQWKRCQGLSGWGGSDVRFCPSRTPMLSVAVRIKRSNVPMCPKQKQACRFAVRLL